MRRSLPGTRELWRCASGPKPGLVGGGPLWAEGGRLERRFKGITVYLKQQRQQSRLNRRSVTRIRLRCVAGATTTKRKSAEEDTQRDTEDRELSPHFTRNGEKGESDGGD